MPRSHTTSSRAARAVVPHTDRPEASFVIVTYGTGPIVVDTIGSLAASLPDGPDYEVIVVDNPHPDHPGRSEVELRLGTAGVRVVVPETNLGFAGGCELGALHARADVLAFVNADVEFHPGWFRPLADALIGEDAPSIVAPVLTDPDGTVQEIGHSVMHTGGTWPNLTRPADGGLVEVDYASAACWVLRRDEHERLGGFDPAYFPAYFEDVDLAMRARRLGGHCAVHTGVEVVHHRGQGTPDSTGRPIRQLQVLMRTWPEIRWTQPTETR